MHFSYGSERIDAVFDHLEAALRRCSELPFEKMTTRELWAVLERFEVQKAKLAAARYELTSPFAGNVGIRHGA